MMKITGLQQYLALPSEDRFSQDTLISLLAFAEAEEQKGNGPSLRAELGMLDAMDGLEPSSLNTDYLKGYNSYKKPEAQA